MQNLPEAHSTEVIIEPQVKSKEVKSILISLLRQHLLEILINYDTRDQAVNNKISKYWYYNLKNIK